jgi:hypothetical protein
MSLQELKFKRVSKRVKVEGKHQLNLKKLWNCMRLKKSKALKEILFVLYVPS